MRTSPIGRAGAVLLVLGGLLEAATFTVGTIVSLPDSTVAGATLLYGSALGLVYVGLGLVTTGITLRSVERMVLIIAGLLGLIVPIVNGVQSATGAPLGPAPSQLAYFLFVAGVVAAALTLLLDREHHRALRWSLVVPAACFLLSVLTLFLPLPAVPGTVVLPWVGMATAGVLLLKARSRPVGATALLS